MKRILAALIVGLSVGLMAPKIAAQEDTGFELPLVKLVADERDGAVTVHVIKNQAGEMARYYVFLEDIEVELRKDKQPYTSVKFRNAHENSSWIRFFKNATILVPKEVDVQIWKNALARYKKERAAFTSMSTVPRRVLPDGGSGSADEVRFFDECPVDKVVFDTNKNVLSFMPSSPSNIPMSRTYLPLHSVEIRARKDGESFVTVQVFVFENDLGHCYARVNLLSPEDQLPALLKDFEDFKANSFRVADAALGKDWPTVFIINRPKLLHEDK